MTCGEENPGDSHKPSDGLVRADREPSAKHQRPPAHWKKRHAFQDPVHQLTTLGIQEHLHHRWQREDEGFSYLPQEPAIPHLHHGVYPAVYKLSPKRLLLGAGNHRLGAGENLL